jgi:hypothetical protein
VERFEDDHDGWDLKFLKGVLPVARAIGILTGEPADHVAIDKIKANKSTAKEAGASYVNSENFSRGWPRGTKAGNRNDGCRRSEVRVLKRRRAPEALGTMTIERAKKGPNIMEDVQEGRGGGRGRAVTGDAAETPTSTTERSPWSIEPEWTTMDAKGKGTIQREHSGTCRGVEESLDMDPDVKQSNGDHGEGRGTAGSGIVVEFGDGEPVGGSMVRF